MTNNGKPSNAEIMGRLEHCHDLIASGKRDSEIRQILRKKYHVSRRTCDRYLSRAREEMVACIGRPKEELIAESYAVYRGVIVDSLSTPSVIVRAQSSIDRLLGLRKPILLAETDRDGRDKPMSREELQNRFLELVSKLKGRASLASGGNGHDLPAG